MSLNPPSAFGNLTVCSAVVVWRYIVSAINPKTFARFFVVSSLGPKLTVRLSFNRKWVQGIDPSATTCHVRPAKATQTFTNCKKIGCSTVHVQLRSLPEFAFVYARINTYYGHFRCFRFIPRHAWVDGNAVAPWRHLRRYKYTITGKLLYTCR